MSLLVMNVSVMADKERTERQAEKAKSGRSGENGKLKETYTTMNIAFRTAHDTSKKVDIPHLLLLDILYGTSGMPGQGHACHEMRETVRSLPSTRAPLAP
jgi:hypothetical protein